MDFDQLATFVFVAKLKSFFRAPARKFSARNPPSARKFPARTSIQSQALDRSAKSVELTPAGEFFSSSPKSCFAADESIQVVADRGNVVQGPVVSAPMKRRASTCSPTFLPISARYPLVHSASIATSATKSCSVWKTFG